MKTDFPRQSPSQGGLHKLAIWLLLILIYGYRYFISPLIGVNCRFSPSCSDYAKDAITRHGALRGGLLTVKRILKCHPWGGSGYDPVP
jgi:putative membrane protein insertion efficiency factor